MQGDYCHSCGLAATFRCPSCGTMACFQHTGSYAVDSHGHSMHFAGCVRCSAPARQAWEAAREGLAMVECSILEGVMTLNTDESDRRKLFIRLAEIAVAKHPQQVVVQGHRGALLQNHLGPGASLLPVGTRHGWTIEVGDVTALLDSDGTWVDRDKPRKTGPPLSAGPHALRGTTSWSESTNLYLRINSASPRT